MVPYAPIEKHGVTGDRRTAALIAADGTVDWLCLPDYDGAPLFGALLDAGRGGFWRMGPVLPSLGSQRYEPDTVLLSTRWAMEGGELELVDGQCGPERDRPPGEADARTLIRRLRCLHGQVGCVIDLQPRTDFGAAPNLAAVDGGLAFRHGRTPVRLWASVPLEIRRGVARAEFRLREGEEAWAILQAGAPWFAWTPERARDCLDQTAAFWRGWLERLSSGASNRESLRRSALTTYLLGYAPKGSAVAAPTSSLPERIGGDRNYDYRLAWVRDCSLSMAMLSQLGDTETASEYMGWLARLESSGSAPLRAVYRASGKGEIEERVRGDLYGYRGSTPVRFGNRASDQRQFDSLGFLADCALTYLEAGGEWYEECWRTVCSAADHVAGNWRKKDSGIWELPERQHYVSSKVMSWVTLDRAVKIAERCDKGGRGVERWRREMPRIHAEVMRRGWSERLGAFRQRYDSEDLDAAALLVIVMGFLPANHPRAVATVERVVERLSLDGLVYRSAPRQTSDGAGPPLWEHDGAFLPCTLWLATAFAKMGQLYKAKATLGTVERIAGETGILAEEVDARSGAHLGNTPLLFTHAEHIRAVLAIAEAAATDSGKG